MGMKEWRRLVRDAYQRLEFNTTMHFLNKHLPKRGLILDAGGGPGRYTIELGKLGYNIILFDLSSEMLKIAERQIKRAKIQQQVKQIIQGSIDDLSIFSDNSFDGVICFGGALSHIIDKTRREKAIDELIRVAKKRSPIFVSVIGKLAVLVAELISFPQEIEIEEVFQSIRDTGDYHGGYGFAPCHFYLPEEIRESLQKRKVTILEMVGLEGLSSGHRKETNRLFKKYPKASKIWWKTHLKTCTHPCSVAISAHFLIICKKQSS